MVKRKQTKATSAKDIRSILRLTCDQRLSVRAISKRLKLSKTTVSTYLLRARQAGLTSWPLSAGLDDDTVLASRLFHRRGRPPRNLAEPDFAAIARRTFTATCGA
ncbi:MAG: winged helix-turn-helix transcriptional regulator [Alphaproteobacteria bacterium]|nr:winged helix-turn-helix transcriptional regulator [Alphaproteobacteria bacterium]